MSANVETSQSAHFHDVLGWNPRFRQALLAEQLPQETRIRLVRLGAALAASQGGRICRLRQVRLHARMLHLLHHEAPAGATFDREPDVLTSLEGLRQPGSERLARGRPQLACADFARIRI